MPLSKATYSLGCVNYASAAESLTITSHPKDGAQGGEVTCSGSHNESVAEVGFEPGTSWLQALFFNHWTTQPPIDMDFMGKNQDVIKNRVYAHMEEL